MKLQIISDGTAAGTRVEDIETGDMLHGVQAVAWEVNIDSGLATVMLRIKNIPIRAEGELDPVRSEILPRYDADADVDVDLSDLVTIRSDEHDHEAPGPVSPPPPEAA